jgi:hypothetical protein
MAAGAGHGDDLLDRLRTPLTALRLEAEAVPASADPDGRLMAQVAAMERAVTALIENARRRGGGAGSCDAAEVISERAAFWSVLAEDQGRDMRLDLAPPPVLVGVAAPELAACMERRIDRPRARHRPHHRRGLGRVADHPQYRRRRPRHRGPRPAAAGRPGRRRRSRPPGSLT